MDVDLIFKIAAIGIIVSVLNQLHLLLVNSLTKAKLLHLLHLTKLQKLLLLSANKK